MLIADDEIDLREGLKMLLDWDALCVDIVGDARNGAEALSKIQQLQPDLALMDIRMPKMRGLDVIRAAKESGCTCRFIITSGYSDFDYARAAMQYGVTHYPTKPVDEDELSKAVLEIREAFEAEQEKARSLRSWRIRARESALRELLLAQSTAAADAPASSGGMRPAGDTNLSGKGNLPACDIRQLGLDAPVYQAVLYTSYYSAHPDTDTCWDFPQLLRLSGQEMEEFDSFPVGEDQIIVLKGPRALQRFQDLLHRHMDKPESFSQEIALPITGRSHELKYRADRQKTVDLKINSQIHGLKLSFIHHTLPAKHMSKFNSVGAVNRLNLPDFLNGSQLSHTFFPSYFLNVLSSFPFTRQNPYPLSIFFSTKCRM